MLKTILIAVSAAALTIITAAPAGAIGLGVSRDIGNMRNVQPLAGKAAPLAFPMFCLRYRAECKLHRNVERASTTRHQTRYRDPTVPMANPMQWASN